MSYSTDSSCVWLFSATRHTGVEAVGSYGSTTGGSVPGGSVGIVTVVSEFTCVSASEPSTSSA